MRTIVHLSDLHFGRIEEATLDPLRRTIEALCPNLIVVSGDLTQRARLEQFRQAREYLATLPHPQLVVPGNHDVPLYNVFKRFLAPLHDFRRVMGDDLEPSFVDDEVAVVGVNTARSLVFKGGRINSDQVARVRALLCPLPETVTKILVTHHPFDVPEGRDQKNQIVGRAKMALEQLADCGADVLLSGHLHEASVQHTAERYHMAGQSALVVQAGTATSDRTRGTTNTFNVLRTAPARITVERHAWTGAGFACEATESFRHDERGWHAG